MRNRFVGLIVALVVFAGVHPNAFGKSVQQAQGLTKDCNEYFPKLEKLTLMSIVKNLPPFKIEGKPVQPNSNRSNYYTGYFLDGSYYSDKPVGLLNEGRKYCEVTIKNSSKLADLKEYTFTQQTYPLCRILNLSFVDSISWNLEATKENGEKILLLIGCYGKGVVVNKPWTQGDVKYHLGKFFNPTFQGPIPEGPTTTDEVGKVHE